MCDQRVTSQTRPTKDTIYWYPLPLPFNFIGTAAVIESFAMVDNSSKRHGKSFKTFTFFPLWTRDKKSLQDSSTHTHTHTQVCQFPALKKSLLGYQNQQAFSLFWDQKSTFSALPCRQITRLQTFPAVHFMWAFVSENADRHQQWCHKSETERSPERLCRINTPGS